MKLWIDDVRPTPHCNGYVHCKSVNQTIDFIIKMEYFRSKLIEKREQFGPNARPVNTFGKNLSGTIQEHIDDITIELIDIDHDAGDYASDGGDYIKLLDWLEETGRNYPIRIHSMNPVGRENMRAIIRRNGWTEVM